MNRKEFRQLLKRYLKGTCTEEEAKWVDRWYELLYDSNIPPIREAEFDELEVAMWNNIQSRADLSGQSINRKSVRTVVLRWSAVAAILVVVVAAFFFKQQDGSHNFSAYEQIKLKEDLREITNTTPGVKIVQLEDGSKVSLQPASKIAYPAHFAAEKREVHLEGEAFFEVSKSPARPFYVYNGKLITQVLGTSFSVKMDKERNQIVIAVRTGRVAVYENKQQVSLNEEQQKTNGVIITPNQKVVYKTDSRYFITSLVDVPAPVNHHEGGMQGEEKFDFEETPVSVVLASLEKTYGIEIMVENENIYRCLFTGNITQQSLYNKLELICQSIQASYEIKGTKILIKGKGCN